MTHEQLKKKTEEFVQVLIESLRDEMLDAVRGYFEPSLATLSQSVEQAATKKTSSPMHNLYTQKEVEGFFGLDRSTIHRKVKEGELSLVKVGRSNYYKKDEVDSLIKY